MHRFKAWSLPTLVALLAAPLWAADAEIPVGVDDAWRRAVLAVAADNATVTLSDERAGIIQATAPLPLAAGKKCMQIGGRLDRVDSKVTITLRAVSATATHVTVQAATQSTWYRYRKFVFIRTGRDYDRPVCPAPELEAILLERIRG